MGNFSDKALSDIAKAWEQANPVAVQAILELLAARKVVRAAKSRDWDRVRRTVDAYDKREGKVRK